MLAELHLTEKAFALHLLLQRPEGLIDIVVTDENLHVVFLFNPTVDRLNSRGAWTLGGTDMRNSLRPDPMSLYSIRLFTGNEKLRQKKLTAKLLSV